MDGPRDEQRRAASAPGVELAALAVAAALALCTSIATVQSPSSATMGSVPSWRAWRVGGVQPGDADGELAGLRAALPVGAVVGYLSPWSMPELMARELDVQRFYTTQYALAPAVLKPLYLPECVARGSWSCGLQRVELLVAPGAAAERAATLGFAPLQAEGGMTLLRRSAR